MSIFGLFDWISPLVHAATDGEQMDLTPAEMDVLQAHGITVHTMSAIPDGDTWLVKVSDRRQAEKVLGWR